MKKPKEKLTYKCENCGQYDDVWTMYYHWINFVNKMMCWSCVHKEIKPQTKGAQGNE